ncbi:MAG TPA: hypothetical protein VFH53_01405, partial [Phycisphaerae bacterium]|nr:hypothetical protein [Phycisphaerae bacterium]
MLLCEVAALLRYEARVLLAVAVLGLVAVQSAQADSATWNGADGGNVLWSDVDNWVGPPAAVPGTGDTATFDNIGFGYASIDTTGGVAINSIVFDNAGAPAYVIGNQGAIQLDNGGNITMNAGVAANQTINAAINVTSTGCTLSNASTTNLLTFSSDITFANLGMVLNKTGAGEVVLNGTNWLNPNIDTNAVGKITVMGGGKLTISAGTTYAIQTVHART